MKARDLDGLPLRCPSEIQEVFREAAATHRSLVLIDGPRVLQSVSRHGIVDDELIQDGQHPTLVGYVALAQDLLRQLARRGAFQWPDGIAAPTIDAAECAADFRIDAGRWAEVCRRTASFYSRTANIRHDPSACESKARRYEQAAAAIEAGVPPRETNVPGVGVAKATKRIVGQRDGSPAIARRVGPTRRADLASEIKSR